MVNPSSLKRLSIPDLLQAASQTDLRPQSLWSDKTSLCLYTTQHSCCSSYIRLQSNDVALLSHQSMAGKLPPLSVGLANR